MNRSALIAVLLTLGPCSTLGAQPNNLRGGRMLPGPSSDSAYDYFTNFLNQVYGAGSCSSSNNPAGPPNNQHESYSCSQGGTFAELKTSVSGPPSNDPTIESLTVCTESPNDACVKLVPGDTSSSSSTQNGPPGPNNNNDQTEEYDIVTDWLQDIFSPGNCQSNPPNSPPQGGSKVIFSCTQPDASAELIATTGNGGPGDNDLKMKELTVCTGSGPDPDDNCVTLNHLHSHLQSNN